jgi:hypothetical protein
MINHRSVAGVFVVELQESLVKVIFFANAAEVDDICSHD